MSALGDVTARLVAILAEKSALDPAAIRPEAKMSALGIDSLALVETIFAVEEIYDISIPYNASDAADDQFAEMSVAGFAARIAALVAARGR